MGIERGRLFNIEGLDATGKSTLAERLREEFEGVMVYCPPDWMKPYRTSFNNSSPDLRFLYYAFGNFWVDRRIVRPLMEKDGQYVFQDRTWLTTLSAHESRGTSRLWLNLGLQVAKRATSPDIAFIIHTDNEVRRQRMIERGIITPDDLESLDNQPAMEQSYVNWAGRLQWNAVVFDNTLLTPDQARDMLADQIRDHNSSEQAG